VRLVSGVHWKDPPVAVAATVSALIMRRSLPAKLTGESVDGGEVGGQTLAEEEGSRAVVGRVLDSVGLAGNNTTSRVAVDGDSGDKAGGEKDGLEEAHVDGCVFAGGVD
jgi:hypothetical protein